MFDRQKLDEIEIEFWIEDADGNLIFSEVEIFGSDWKKAANDLMDRGEKIADAWRFDHADEIERDEMDDTLHMGFSIGNREMNDQWIG